MGEGITNANEDVEKWDDVCFKSKNTKNEMKWGAVSSIFSLLVYV